MEAELTELLDLNQKQIQAMEEAQRKEEETSLDIYCTVDEIRNSINKLDTPPLQEISLNKVCCSTQPLHIRIYYNKLPILCLKTGP